MTEEEFFKKEEEKFRKEAGELIEKTIRRASIFADGVQSEFWKELVAMLAELENKAFVAFTNTNASDMAAIIEQQQIGKLRRVLEAKVNAAIEAADQFVQ